MKRIDVRQSEFRMILQQLFPYVAEKTLDILLESIDSDLTPPLRVDANNPASLIVNVGPSIVSNPESLRQRSISFVGNVIPVLVSGTVTFPSTNGGTISTSTGQTYILTLPSSDYAQALLSFDSGGNILVTVGTPNAVLASAEVPPPGSSALPFAYVTLHNNAGIVQNISQNEIFQLVGGGGSGAGVGFAQEVAATIATTSQVITFPSALPGINYIVTPVFVNLIDSYPQFQTIVVSNKTTTGFTASWNAPLDSSNYFIDYMVPDVQEQSGEIALAQGITTITVSIPNSLSGTTYSVIANLVNLVDPYVQFQPVEITGKTNTTFTVSWNAPTDSVNYRLAYRVAEYQ